jgi:hypothetical protein
MGKSTSIVSLTIGFLGFSTDFGTPKNYGYCRLLLWEHHYILYLARSGVSVVSLCSKYRLNNRSLIRLCWHLAIGFSGHLLPWVRN